MNTIFNLFLDIPLWVIAIFTFLILLFAFEIGLSIGERHRLAPKTPIIVIIGTALGLLAFLLAFTFGISATRFNEKRELVVEESKALETAYLQADYLAEPLQNRY
jgi:hypothetical protein